MYRLQLRDRLQLDDNDALHEEVEPIASYPSGPSAIDSVSKVARQERYWNDRKAPCAPLLTITVADY
jgi:hypothetical protein